MKMLVDTNVLVLLVIGMTDPEYIAKHKRTRTKYGVDHFNRLWDLVSQADGIVCTPNVVTEAANLLNQSRDPMRAELMRKLAELVVIWEEIYVPSRTAAVSPRFLRFGLTDTAILSLPERPVKILTDDLALFAECFAVGLDAVNVTPFLYE